MKKLFEIGFPIFRVLFYLALFGTFMFIPVKTIEQDSFCIIYKSTHLLCFSCGITRSFSNIMHLNFSRAFLYNPIFLVAIFPIFFFIFMEDMITIVSRLLSKKEKKSLLEKFLFGKLI